jgi:flagellar biosynthesis/type III secretory pathway protein FliH
MLPTMENVDKQILLQAVEDLIKYYENGNAPLARRLLWFSILLRRSETVSPEDKQIVQERLHMYDDLLEQDAFVKKQRELGRELGREEGRQEGKEEGRQEGKEEGEMKASQKILVELVNIRYPSLVELARQKAMKIRDASALQEVIKIIVAVPDEETVRIVLSAA